MDPLLNGRGRPGWGWKVSGPEYPHLPFHGLWIDWSRFPMLDELALVSSGGASTGASKGAAQVLEAALRPFAHGAGGSLHRALERARAYLFATRRNLIYGSGDCATSTDFGLAPRRFLEAALFRVRNATVPAFEQTNDQLFGPQQHNSSLALGAGLGGAGGGVGGGDPRGLPPLPAGVAGHVAANRKQAGKDHAVKAAQLAKLVAASPTRPAAPRPAAPGPPAPPRAAGLPPPGAGLSAPGADELQMGGGGAEPQTPETKGAAGNRPGGSYPAPGEEIKQGDSGPPSGRAGALPISPAPPAGPSPVADAASRAPDAVWAKIKALERVALGGD
mmetsp:Transcript_29600/g.66360  ORF Transcript_29600/g.66360 Transcript_29600/m.66360 type:complete len:332 (+) Transcript_29600:22-1017(+)